MRSLQAASDEECRCRADKNNELNGPVSYTIKFVLLVIERPVAFFIVDPIKITILFDDLIYVLSAINTWPGNLVATPIFADRPEELDYPAETAGDISARTSTFAGVGAG